MFDLTTHEKHEIVNITEQVAKEVAASGVQDGVCFIQSLHTTAGIFVNVTEDLQQDIIDMLENLAPTEQHYRHNRYDPNAEAHLKKILVGRTATVTITNGKLNLGTWEKIQFAEFDGPRRRNVHVKIIGA